ncbi:hypothetical protein D3C87_1649000 [compost metagenome]
MPVDGLDIGRERAEHAKCPGMGIDETGADPAGRGEAELFGGDGCQRTEIGADGACDLRQGRLLNEVFEPHLGEKVLPPLPV